MADKVLSLLGIAEKGRKLASGEFQTLEAVKSGKAKLVILAQDASDNTRKKFTDKCTYYGVNLISYSDKTGLGAAIGKDLRSVLAVCDKGLSVAVIKKFEESGGVKNGKEKNS